MFERVRVLALNLGQQCPLAKSFHHSLLDYNVLLRQANANKCPQHIEAASARRAAAHGRAWADTPIIKRLAEADTVAVPIDT